MMRDKNLLVTVASDCSLNIETNPTGELSCFIKGASEKESALFVKLMEEILAPVNNSRYLLVCNNWVQRLFGFSNYFSVPSIFGERKNDAQLFYNYWRLYNGPAKLIFTRTQLGRKMLIKARFHYLNTKGSLKTKSAAIWK